MFSKIRSGLSTIFTQAFQIIIQYYQNLMEAFHKYGISTMALEQFFIIKNISFKALGQQKLLEHFYQAICTSIKSNECILWIECISSELTCYSDIRKQDFFIFTFA